VGYPAEMARESRGRSGPWTARIVRLSSKAALALLIVAILWAGSLPVLGSAIGAIEPRPPAAVSTPGIPELSSVRPPTGGPGNATNLSGDFFSNTSQFSLVSIANASCPLGSCEQESADPSLVHLPNGDVGLGFDETSDQTNSSCAAAVNLTTGVSNTTVNVGFALSGDGGSSFRSPVVIAPAPCPPYDQDFEPSFAASGSTVYGAFVESNASPVDFGPGPFFWTGDPSDALGFVRLSDNATVLGPVTELTAAGTGWLARPEVAAFGNTVYVLYLQSGPSPNASNLGFDDVWCEFFGTIGLPYPGCAPAYANLLYSTDGGVTWHGPYLLPGMDAATYNGTTDASMAVAPNGTLAVAYSVNGSCITWCSGQFATVQGMDEVAAISTTNGTSWSVSTVARNLLPTLSPDGILSAVYAALPAPPEWQFGPQVSVAWTSSGQLDVAGTNGINELNPLFDTFVYQTAGIQCSDPGSAANLSANPYGLLPALLCVAALASDSSAWFGSSANEGGNWTVQTVFTPSIQASGPGGDYLQLFGGAVNPEVAAAPGGAAWITFSDLDDGDFNLDVSVGASGCGPYTPDGLVPSSDYSWDIQDLTTSSNSGATWTQPIGIDNVASANAVYPENYYLGYTSALLTNGASPIVAYPLPSASGTATYSSPIDVATPYSGPTSPLEFSESGLPSGALWTATVDAYTVSGTGPNINFTGLPTGWNVLVSWGPDNISVPGDAQYFVSTPTQPYVTVATTKVVYLTYLKFYPVTFAIDAPTILIPPGFNLNVGGGVATITWEYYWQYYPGLYPATLGCPGPWYLPANQTLIEPTNLSLSGPLLIGSWIGNGTGSYSGPDSTFAMTVDGPINETANAGTWGTNFSLNFSASGLPSSSSYGFTFDQQRHTSAASSSVALSGLTTGAYPLTNVTATSSQTGWMYFGFPESGNPILVPNDPSVVINYSALVDVAAATTPFTLHADGIGAETPWTVVVNGTTFSATGPWLNLSLKPGSYAAIWHAAVSANDSEAFAPTTPVSEITVTVGGSATVPYAPAFSVTAAATSGGAINATGTTWETAGQNASFKVLGHRANFTFGGWSGTGPGSYTGPSLFANVTVSDGPIIETAIFYAPDPARFYLNFTATGLANGTFWTVFVGGLGYSSRTGSISVPGLYTCGDVPGLGLYLVSIPYVLSTGSPEERFVPGGYNTSECGGVSETVHFHAQYPVLVLSSAGGSTTQAYGSLIQPTSFWLPAGSQLDLGVFPVKGYAFANWTGVGTGNYSGPLASVAFTPGGAVTETANFVPLVVPLPVRYSVSLHLATALGAGVAWTASINGTAYATSGDWLNVTGFLPGTYLISISSTGTPNRSTEYTPIAPPSSATITDSNVTDTIHFLTRYWVSIDTIGTGTVSPSSGFVTAGSQVDLNATPSGAEMFRGWTGEGVGSYTGPNANVTLTVKGPINETATFAAAPPGAGPGQVTGFLGTTTAVALFAVLGLVAGVVVGFAVWRGRRGTNTSPVEWLPRAPVSGDAADREVVKP
jgi:Divergent InlB B-repeat domain